MALHSRWIRSAALCLLLVSLVQASGQQQADEAAPGDLCIITIVPSKDFGVLTVTVDLVLNGSARDALAQRLDTDDDGHVDEREWRDHQAEEAWNGTQDDLGVRRVGLGGPEVQENRTLVEPVQVQRVPTTPTLPLVVAHRGVWLIQEQWTYTFDHEGIMDTVVTLYSGQDGEKLRSHVPYTHPEGQIVEEFIVVQAPEGHVVSRVQGSGYDRVVDMRPWTQQVEVPSFDVKSPYRIVFAPDDVDPGPPYPVSPVAGSGPVLALSVFVAVSFLVLVLVLVAQWAKRGE